MSLFPFVAFEAVPLATANVCLERWGHRMGPVRRPCSDTIQHALLCEGQPLAVAVTAGLVRPSVGGGLVHLTRENTRELARVCAARPGLSRVVLRLWREFVFPALKVRYAISYQDAALHTGDLYRFDGWRRLAFSRAGGTDARSGRKGRNKWIWLWEAGP
jgi:hypothetical protein